MSENMALLSQNEIDALVKFLLEKQNIQSGVLDQGSIDRLVNVLQDKSFIQKMGVAEEPMQNTATKTVTQLLLLEGEQDFVIQQTNYELLFECDAEGMVQVVCQSRISAKRHFITPACLEQSRYTEEENSAWGRTISPILFDAISGMLHIRYSKETFLAVCDCFAEVVYGNKNAEIPAFYMPNASSLMQHMLG